MQDERTKYRSTLISILESHIEEAGTTLMAALSKLPNNAREIQFGVHPNQDPDGMFSVVLHLDGPDLFSLNKAIEEHRVLFDAYTRGESVDNDLPMFDPFDQPFSVNDVIVEVAADWLEKIWSALDKKADCPPAVIFGEDGWGTGMPRHLS